MKSCGSGAAVLALSLRLEARATEAKEPFSGKSTKKAVKPLRREGRDAPAALYARVQFFVSAKIAHGTAGAASTRSSLRPLISERANEMQTSGEMRRENAKLYQPSLRAKRSNPCRDIKKEWIASLRSQ